MAETETGLTLPQAHLASMNAANSSWSDTDKLYVTVSSGLVAVAALLGRDGPDGDLSTALVGGLLLFLAANWWLLIRRYRRKISRALNGLRETQHAGPLRSYYEEEAQRFEADISDYYIVAIVVLLALLLLAWPFL